MELSAALVGTYATMYADNYFSSPALVKQLLEKKSGKKTKTQDLQRGDLLIFHCKEESINVIKWVDNKPVHNITSKNPCAEVENVMRRRKRQAEKISVGCPSVIKDYNKYIRRSGHG